MLRNLMRLSLTKLLISTLFIINSFNTLNGLSIAGDRDGRKLFGGYKITPKFCTNAKMSKADAKVVGPAICMFNHECVERKGQVIGTCMDGFLFGTCCLISGVVETSLANVKANLTQYQQNQAVMEDLATRGPSIVTSKPHIINNQFYGGADELYEEDGGVKHEISNEAVMVSPSYADRISSSSYHQKQPTTSQSYVTELPNFIQSSPSSSYFTSSSSDEESSSNNYNNLIQFSKTPYDHSDIKHSPADSDIYSHDDDDNSVINPYPNLMTEKRTTDAITSSTAAPTKFPSKPLFKPKPTQTSAATISSATEKYVLVHTITNEKQPVKEDEIQTKKPSTTNESIQSIILMLNGTTNDNSNNQQGPSYTIESTTAAATSTSSKPTRKTTNIKTKATTTRSVSKQTTKSPLLIQKPTTLNVPSTSYIYSPNPITKRPGASTTTKLKTTSSTQAATSKNPIKSTTPKPALIISTQQQVNDEIESNYVVISGGGITKHPSPTVHITPKPITNILTSSTMQQLQTKRPQGDSAVQSTERPIPPFYGSTTPATFISSSIYVPSQSVQDFHNEGYFAVVTHRPGVSSTAIYAVSPGLIHENLAGGVKDETPVIHNDDLSNFPPVRNPNLNMTAANSPVAIDDISTPSFIEDSQLNSKIDLLVNKLIESMQGNLDNLVDIVYERKNLTTIDENKKKNVTSTIKPQRTTVSSKVTTSKPPQKTTGRPSLQQQQSTKKPATATKATTSTATTSKKPTATKKPASSAKPATTTTKRPPNRVTATSTTVTKKPVTKRTTTTTTTKAPELEDEQTYEEEESAPVEEESEATEEEATNEDGEESNVVDETEEIKPPPFDGKIQCGIRPQYKKGRIVGGTAASFGEFPWQVLVRESTWLGLFTKNKCGGVLISNSYVLTAAHCQPGFLASLVTVFGEYDISGDLETKRSVSKNVKRVIVHRQYDAATFENDLAILELESPVRYDTHIVPICMPPDGADYTGKVATVSGWGRLKYGGGVPSVLQEVQVPIIENTVCQDMFEHAGHKKKILPSFLCAGYANGQKDSCEGYEKNSANK
ncbi:hypothetical protein PVAND_009835 [Polypedilum vanderplanki]|uniref:Peptidase S1 domain-containing protein n=1 Tax=Polypedilum vanderplanki TaxID=319348 RepID=A0A9J6CEW9_POLVA|nr:hypothetical protein PVAND_009835 [Polypedilum vanderplanki]